MHPDFSSKTKILALIYQERLQPNWISLKLKKKKVLFVGEVYVILGLFKRKFISAWEKKKKINKINFRYEINKRVY